MQGLTSDLLKFRLCVQLFTSLTKLSISGSMWTHLLSVPDTLIVDSFVSRGRNTWIRYIYSVIRYMPIVVLA